MWDALARAVERVREAVADWRWGQPGRSLRRLVQPYLTHFVGDIFVYLNAWFAGCTGTPGGPCNGANADFDGAGGVVIDDIFQFLNAWFTGC